MVAIASRLRRQYPKTDKDLGAIVVLFRDVVSGPARLPLFVLLMACLNVAGLFVARIVNRRPEFAVRQALGAGRGRIVRLLLAESAWICGIGGLLPCSRPRGAWSSCGQ